MHVFDRMDESIQITAGLYILGQDTTNLQFRTVTKSDNPTSVISHPDFVLGQYGNDLAIILLSENLTENGMF
jgi:hypothetical protein